MKTKILGLLAILSLFVWNVYAGELAWFVVQIEPSTIKVWEPADLTIKAIDENGDIVEDYEGDVIMSVVDKDGNELDTADYVLPNDGNYSFLEEDQGEKKFTKWLTINKAWEYKVIVEDFETEQSGEGDVKVINPDATDSKWTVTISTPQDWETIVDSVLSVAWSAPNYRNSKVEVLIDGKKVEEWQVDESWNFQIDIQDIPDGTHTLQVNVLDIDNNVVASSKKITINVALKKDLLKDIKILPSEQVEQGTKVEVQIKVAPQVSSAVLKVSNYGEYPMDRMTTDTFTTQFVANTPGTFDISVDLKGEFWEKTYDNIKKLVVIEKIAIQNVKFVRDNPKKTIDLTWDFSWQVPAFKVIYGTEKDKLDMSAIVTENKYTIKNIDEGKTYFVQIIPTDTSGNKIWDASNVIVIEPDMKKAATCTIDNIKVDTVVEGGKHYLVWKAATWAVEYNIYKWDKESDLVKIATTKDTTYEIPFNKNAKKVEYAYFAVKAVCDDGSEKQIDKVKKVKVGPMDWLIYAIIIAMMVYGLKLAYRTN